METTTQATTAPSSSTQAGRSTAVSTTTTPKNNKGKAIAIGVGIVALCIGGYYLVPFIKRKLSKDKDSGNNNTPNNNAASLPQASDFTPVKTTSSSAPKVVKETDGFPLKQKSKGARVLQLQNALNAKYKAGLVADGDFGSKTEGALVSNGLPKVVDETTFNVLLQNSSPDPAKLASDLFASILAQDFGKALANASKITSPEQYSKVAENFKNHKFGFTSYTIVNALLTFFKTDTQKEQLRNVFAKMGLKYDGNKWSLSGLDGFNLVTIKPTLVWKDAQTAIKVPASLVLGQEIERRGQYVAFESSGRKFLVPVSDVRYA